jgi:chloramphenicol-sensitive protein RarD
MNKTGSRLMPISGFLIIAVCNIVWGLLPLYWRILQTVPTAQIVCQRLLWSGLALALLLVCTQKIKTLLPVLKNKKALLIIALCSALLCINWMLYLRLINSGHVLQASFGIYLYPLLTAALSMLLLQDRISLLRWLAVGLALVGTFCQIGADNGLAWVAALMALCTALYSLIRTTVKLETIPLFLMETLVAVPVAACLLLYWRYDQTLVFAGGESLQDALLIGSGLVTVAPLVFMRLGLHSRKNEHNEHSGRGITLTGLNLLHLLSPSLIFVLGLFVFKEHFTLRLLISFALVWAGLALYNLDNIKRYNLLNKLRKIPDEQERYAQI